MEQITRGVDEDGGGVAEAELVEPNVAREG
jgi:hypothetical protein